VLTGQAKPDVYMLSKQKFKRTRSKKVQKINRIETQPVEVVVAEEEKPKKKPGRKPKAVEPVPIATVEPKPQETEETGKNFYGMRYGTLSARIAEMIEKNRFTAKEISERIDKPAAYVSGIIIRMEKSKKAKVYFEIKNGRRVLCVERINK
jgi:hypothetical protein